MPVRTRPWGAFRSPSPQNRARLAIETLEDRCAPYSLSGNIWPHPELITISFVPDGTNLGGYTSNLFSTFNAKFGSAATWQNQILKAAQQWAQQTNINFAVVSDSGVELGGGNKMQGSGNFGDIRIGGYNFGTAVLGQAYLPPMVNNYSIAGDFQFNTGAVFNIGTTYDLFTVSMHEFGHVLGLYHGNSGSLMGATYNGTKTALATDDINGIKAAYSAGLARTKDAYDLTASNETFATAKNITSVINTTTKAGVVNNMDLTTSTDVDWYKFTVPSGSTSTLKAIVQSTGMSLMAPKVEIYNSSNQLKASATAASTDFDGATVSASWTGIASGQTWYVKVSSTSGTTAFKTGRYGLVLNMGTGADPAITVPNTATSEGSPRQSGGGQAVHLFNVEARANTTTSNTQQLASNGHRSLAMDIAGSYVVTWASLGQDGSGWGIYAQCFDRNGVAKMGEFRVNTSTSGDQLDPVAAMDLWGNFVIAWTDTSSGGNGAEIYAQRYDLNGAPVDGETRVNTTRTGDQSSPSVGMDVWGRTVITWTSSDGNGTGIYAQRFDSNWDPNGAEFLVNTTTSKDQADAALGMNRLTGDFMVTWSSYGQDKSNTWGVYAKRYNSSGVAQGSEFQVNTTTGGSQTDPAIAVHRLTGDFIITWTGLGNSSNEQDIYAQRYKADGTPQGGEFRVNTTTADDQTNSTVAIDPGGNFTVAWSSEDQDGSGAGIYAQHFTSSGALLETEFRVSGTTAGEQDFPSISIDNLGQLVTVWSGNGTGDSGGVFYQLSSTSKMLVEDHSQAGAPVPSGESAKHLSVLGFDVTPTPALPSRQGQSADERTPTDAIFSQLAATLENGKGKDRGVDSLAKLLHRSAKRNHPWMDELFAELSVDWLPDR